MAEQDTLLDLANPIKSLSRQTFSDKLNEVTRSKWRKCPKLLEIAMKRLSVVLQERIPSNHEWDTVQSLAWVCIDNSLINRPESSIECRSNRPLAAIGGKALTLEMDVQSFLTQKTSYPQRTRCEKEVVAKMYDSLFRHDNPVILGWEKFPCLLSAPSDQQKADFMEALIGYMHITDNRDVARRIASLQTL
jgi:hypothetical protein